MKEPRHGTTVTVRLPTHDTRRRWCGVCKVWTWEVWPPVSGVFRHGKGSRRQACKDAAR